MENMHYSSHSRNRFQQTPFREKSGDRHLGPIEMSKIPSQTSFFQHPIKLQQKTWKKHRYELTCWVRFFTRLDLTKALSGIRTEYFRRVVLIRERLLAKEIRIRDQGFRNIGKTFYFTVVHISSWKIIRKIVPKIWKSTKHLTGHP